MVDWPSREQALRQLGVVALVTGIWGMSLVGVLRIAYSGGDAGERSAKAERSTRPAAAAQRDRAGPTEAPAGGHEAAVPALDEPPAADPSTSETAAGTSVEAVAEAPAPAEARTLGVDPPSDRAGSSPRVDAPIGQPGRDPAAATERPPASPTPASADDDPFQVDEAEVGDLGGIPSETGGSDREAGAALPDAEYAPMPSPLPGEEAVAETGDGAATVSFSRDVLPILDRRCVKCHGGERPQGGQRIEEGLSLLSWEDVLAGSTWGVVVVPGDPVGSFLLEQVEKGEMPEKEPRLLPREIRVIRQWIEAGAPKN